MSQNTQSVRLIATGYHSFKDGEFQISANSFVQACRLIASEDQSLDSELAFNAGVACLQVSDFALAAEFLIKSLQADPFQAIALYYLAVTKMQMGEEKLASDLLSDTINCIRRRITHQFLPPNWNKSRPHHQSVHIPDISHIDYKPLGVDMKLTVEHCESFDSCLKPDVFRPKSSSPVVQRRVRLIKASSVESNSGSSDDEQCLFESAIALKIRESNERIRLARKKFKKQRSVLSIF